MKVVLIAVMICAGLNFSMCRHGYVYRDSYDELARSRDEQMELSRLAQLDTLKWNAFLECSADQGDLGCDSCFTMIYGFSLEFK